MISEKAACVQKGTVEITKESNDKGVCDAD